MDVKLLQYNKFMKQEALYGSMTFLLPGCKEASEGLERKIRKKPYRS